jgi:hypothetical protein
MVKKQERREAGEGEERRRRRWGERAGRTRRGESETTKSKIQDKLRKEVDYNNV